jgi:hypothetical protein
VASLNLPGPPSRFELHFVVPSPQRPRYRASRAVGRFAADAGNILPVPITGAAEILLPSYPGMTYTAFAREVSASARDMAYDGMLPAPPARLAKLIAEANATLSDIACSHQRAA